MANEETPEIIGTNYEIPLPAGVTDTTILKEIGNKLGLDIKIPENIKSNPLLDAKQINETKDSIEIQPKKVPKPPSGPPPSWAFKNKLNETTSTI